ncbi:MAG TPA: Ig-like domain-containing protein, partial [Nitrososphaeraceae archaeon]|nr:Ig-like domain-containing protein [Nitrososphaeraceae archaeon]
YSYQSTGSCWFTKIAPIDSITKITFGNHEDEASEGLSGYKSHFGISQTYYAYTHDVTRVIVMDTDVADPSDAAQKNFVQGELQSASTNPNIKWIIVYLHKPFFTSPNSCSSTGCTNDGSAAEELRDNYQAWFDQYGVDLVLQGHVHNYQRTFQLKYDPGSPESPTIGSNNANTYTEGNGVIYAIVGTGGVGFHPLSGKASFVSSQQDDFFGQLDIKTTDNGNKLEGKFFRNGNNAILDSFSITKAPNSPPTANSQIALTGKDTIKRLGLTASDPDNNPLTYSIVSQPQHGTITGGTGQVRTYTPTAGYTGTDSFTFRANDGNANSNTATVSITVVDPATCPAELPISSAFASANDGNLPSNVLDNNLNTRWSNSPGQSWIAADLGSTKNVCSVDLAWYLGNQREYAYIIIKSTDGNTWTDVFSGSSTFGTIQVNRANTANIEKNFIPATNARYIGIIAAGLSNSLVGITELDVFSPTFSLTGSYQYDPSLSLTGPK